MLLECNAETSRGTEQEELGRGMLQSEGDLFKSTVQQERQV